MIILVLNKKIGIPCENAASGINTFASAADTNVKIIKRIYLLMITIHPPYFLASFWFWLLNKSSQKSNNHQHKVIEIHL